MVLHAGHPPGCKRLALPAPSRGRCCGPARRGCRPLAAATTGPAITADVVVIGSGMGGDPCCPLLAWSSRSSA